MKTPKNRKHFLRTSGISVSLATFLVVGLGGCDGSNDSVATKQQKCKLEEYRLQHVDECQNIQNTYGNTNVNSGGHSSGSSWIPMWMMMHSVNSNAHSGYSYSSESSTKSSGFFSSSGSHSSSSGSHGGSSSSGG